MDKGSKEAIHTKNANSNNQQKTLCHTNNRKCKPK